MEETIFQGFLMGGFECSTHRNRRGKRLDLIAATRHDRLAKADYQRLLDMGMETARDGVRWHLIEPEPFRYDFSSLTEQVRAARETGLQIIWDLFHYGYPDDLNLFSDEFRDRYAGFVAATTRFLKDNLGENLFLCPFNETSFFSWAAGEVGVFYPYTRNRGNEFKRQAVRTTIRAIEEIKSVCPAARLILTDPAIHVVAGRKTKARIRAAEQYRRAQFEAFDMLAGRREPELGGRPEYLDIIGLNYYFHNQWHYPGRRKIRLGHKEYRPLHEILREYHERYGRPMFIAETGIEDEERPAWFRYVCEQVRLALAGGVPVQGICLYPIVNHPGWEDNRRCHNGLWCYANKQGEREIYQPLADEILLQNRFFAHDKALAQSG